MVYYFKTNTSIISEPIKQNTEDDEEYDIVKLNSLKLVEQKQEFVELVIYMGKDKFENESLIEHSVNDIWFHVDNFSSAHVYLRLPLFSKIRKIYRETNNLNHIPEALQDCLSLVKANSIEGSKRKEVDVVYTDVKNLKKTSDMAPGQVGYHDRRKVVTIRNVGKNKDLVNRLNKTKEERYPDLAKEKKEILDKITKFRKERNRKLKQKEKEEKAARLKRKEERSYSKMFEDKTLMKSNADLESSKTTEAAVDFEEDFM